MNYWSKVYFFLLINVFIVSCNYYKRETIESFLTSNGFNFALNDHPILSDFTPSKGLSHDSAQIKTFKSDKDSIIRMIVFQVADRKAARDLIEQRAALITELFQDKFTEYRGKYVVPQSCLQKNQVQSNWYDIEGGFYVVYNLMSDKNFIYGSCLNSNDFFKSQFLLIYCESAKAVIESKLFYNKNQSIVSTPIINCKK